MPSDLAPQAAPSRTRQLVLAAPALVVVVVAGVWSWRYGGFPATHWYPGAVGLLLVAGALAAGLRPCLRMQPRSVLIALGALALFTAWSFASIAWADDQGVAWDGANRTLLYLVMFAIPALSWLDGSRTLLVVGGWTAGILALAVWVLLALPDSVGPGPVVLGPGLGAPIGYANAQACLWLMAAWPAFVLSTRTVVAPALRGLFAAGTIVLIDLALLSESQGALIAAAISLVVLLACLPGRARALLGLLPVGIGVALSAPRVLDASDAVQKNRSAIEDLASVASPVLLAAALAGLIVGAAALGERRHPASPEVTRRARRAVAATAIVLAVLGAGAALRAAGSPVDRVQEEWRSFKRGAGVATAGRAGFSDGFGGARYDYYRVALGIIGDHPLQGVGADNFAQDYAARGRALEFSAYVHSIELRTLVHTGIVGGLLLALALGAMLATAWRAARTGGGRTLGVAVSAAATIGAVQWLVQGSADWFWEFPALGGAAFALLGVACALAPRRAVATAQGAPRAARLAGSGAGVALLLAAAASLVLPWTAAIEVQRAGDTWPKDPAAAFRQLDLAADLNPLSSQPALTEGTIALRLKRLKRARDAFTRALERDPREPYATLALGAIASQQGQRERALAFLRQAAELNRQDGVTRGALQQVRAGKPVDIAELLRQLEQLARDTQR